MARLHRLRNRIAHHEPLINPANGTTLMLDGRYADLLDVAGYISEEIRSYIQGQSSLASQIAAYPTA